MSNLREPVSGLTHLLGALLGLAGLLWLVSQSYDEPGKLISMVVYGLSLVLLYSASAALHLIHASPRTFEWLLRFDHAAIFGLIAGSATPICYNLLSGHWRWGLLGAFWGMALLGIGFKLLYRSESTLHSTLFYAATGWIGLLGLPKLVEALPPGGLFLILAGGLVYSLGAVIFSLRWPNLHPHFGFHEIWHLFVMGGSALHFAAVVVYVV